MYAVQLKTLLAPWLLPPVALFVLAAIGLAVSLRWPRTGRWLIGLAAATGVLLSLPVVSGRLMAWVEAPFAALDPAPARLPAERMARWRQKPDEAPQAIVLLGGGSSADGADSRAPNRLTAQSLERVLQVRRLARMTGLPILISGGVAPGGGAAEANLMRQVLEDDLGQPARWLELRSRDTAENARFSRDILLPQGLKRILLVTHGYHMQRARLSFEREGFVVIPAPHTFQAGPFALNAISLTPTMDAMNVSRTAVREMIGLLWYRFAPWPSSSAAR